MIPVPRYRFRTKQGFPVITGDNPERIHFSGLLESAVEENDDIVANGKWQLILG